MSITYDAAVAGGMGRPVRVRREAKPAPLRLTRRGRLAVVLLFLVMMVAGLSFTMSTAAAGKAHHRIPATVTVQPGESLWQVATRVAPDADPRLVIDQLVRINHLSGAAVAAGQQLVVPSS